MRTAGRQRARATSTSWSSEQHAMKAGAPTISGVDAAARQRRTQSIELAGAGLLLQAGKVAQPVEGLHGEVEQHACPGRARGRARCAPSSPRPGTRCSRSAAARNASGSSFSALDVMSTMGRCTALIVSRVSGMWNSIWSSSQSRSLGNSRSALSISSMRSTTRSSLEKRPAQHAELDVPGDVADVAVRRTGRRTGAARCRRRTRPSCALVVDFTFQIEQRHLEALGDALGQHGLAGAGLALDEQRAAQLDRYVDRSA